MLQLRATSVFAFALLVPHHARPVYALALAVRLLEPLVALYEMFVPEESATRRER
jgi:hypothetical protein